MIKAKLNKRLIKEFNENGFLIFNEFLDTKYLDKLKKTTQALFEGKFETGIEPDEWNWKFGRDSKYLTRQICNAWKSDNSIKRLVCNPIIGKFCSKLMNWTGSRLIQDNVLWKPPKGKTLAFHQDAAYDDWIIPQTMVTCWISLDYTSKKKGTLEYVNGSHKWSLEPPKGKFHSPNNYKLNLSKFAEKNGKKIDITYVNIPPGGATFHHGYTWHGSGINRTKYNRRTIVAHCVPQNAKFHPVNVGGTGRIYKKYKIKNSDQLHDSFFPILWSAN